MNSSKRVYNFNAGPAVLPLPVLKQAQEEMLDYKGTGMSVMEISHRSKEFEALIREAETDLKDILSIPPEYKVLFLQGGASLQFSMVPMNLLGAGQTADYVNTGAWASKAIKEAKKLGGVNVLADTSKDIPTTMPDYDALPYTPGAAYVHVTSNETIAGTQMKRFPKTEAPLVADMSSDILCRPVDVTQFGLIYAGAQKNLGSSGVTLVVMRDLAERAGRLPDHAAVPHAREGKLALQHPADLRHLHPHARHPLAARKGRRGRHREDQPGQGRQALRGH